MAEAQTGPSRDHRRAQRRRHRYLVHGSLTDWTPIPRIVLSRSAVDKLLADPMLHRWQRGELGRTLPVLWYFRRACSIRHDDGVLTEHGDGFTLTFSEPEALEQPALARRTVAVTEELDIVVVAREQLLSGDLLIGWRGWTYTCERLDG